jgi:hypothetical protein
LAPANVRFSNRPSWVKRFHLGASGEQRAVGGGLAPLTVNDDPGNDWNVAVTSHRSRQSGRRLRFN